MLKMDVVVIIKFAQRGNCMFRVVTATLHLSTGLVGGGWRKEEDDDVDDAARQKPLRYLLSFFQFCIQFL